jgi:hypothetical protein
VHGGYLNDTIEELGLKKKVQFYMQPSNSPDFRVGLFNTVQVEFFDTSSRNSVKLIKMVERLR